ncbi:DUF2961 domain-containing protein [bacterium]|nr:DUF2961 domain-containing protein [bacterium]
MIKRLDLYKLKLAILMALFVVLSGDICSSQAVTGLDALEQISDWPVYRQGVQSLQVSSYDQTGGDSDHSGYLYQEGFDFVIFDQAGPGCIYRIWMRGTASSDNRVIKFYFDGEIVPRINTTVAELFSGLEQPYLAPLAGNTTVSSGGYYCYFPFQFENHLKIALRGRLEAHQIQYHLYPAGTAIESFTGSEDPSTIINQWSNTGSDPKNTSGYITESGAVDLLPRQSTAFFDYSGPGSIESVRLTLSPVTLSVLENLILRYTWDTSELAQVDVSLGSFFDCSLGATNIDGLLLGVEGNEFYCFFPMPFWEAAHLEIYNSSVVSTVDLDYEVNYKTDSYEESAGYFTARKQGLTNSTPGQPIQLGSLAGHGNFVGLSLALIFPANQQVLHSDLRCYIDGRAHPMIQGTNLDGDFNAGNYLSTGAFDLPMHGFPLVTPGVENQICAYRHFLGDLIPFSTNLSLYAENGPSDNAVLEYSAVIYAYTKPELTLLYSDEIDVGDEISEIAHGYTVQGGQTSQSHYYTYPGIADDKYFTDDGRTIFGQVNFTIAVDPDNLGVRLARRRDASILPQAVVVYVEGDSIGIWWDSDFNNYQRWGDSVFEIPEIYASGLSELDINLTYLTGEGWTEYYYWISSHVAPYQDLIPPEAVTNLAADAQESGAELLLYWDSCNDNAGISHYRIYRSAEWGVEPVEDYFLGNSNLHQYLDGDLLPGSYYYYIVTAVDFAGNEGMPSEEVEGRTSGSFVFEGEAFDAFLSSSGDTSLT